jgi:CheY-like chemotaxis protein
MTKADSPALFLDGLCVLVVEDEAIISFLLEDMLGELGATHIRHAANVSSALGFLAERTPDLALLDVNLGGERVYPVAEKLEAAGVTFLFTTGYGRGGIDPRWASKTVVQKPFSIEHMTMALREVLPAR